MAKVIKETIILLPPNEGEEFLIHPNFVPFLKSRMKIMHLLLEKLTADSKSYLFHRVSGAVFLNLKQNYIQNLILKFEETILRGYEEFAQKESKQSPSQNQQFLNISAETEYFG